MLDINLIRKKPEEVKKGISQKGANPKLVNKFLKIDEEWRAKIEVIDELRREKNTLAEKIAKNKIPDLISKSQLLKERLKQLENEEKDLREKKEEILLLLPNLPLPDTPLGSEKDNIVIKKVGEARKGGISYLDIAEKNGYIDTKKTAKMSGTRMGTFLSKAARLEIALINFTLEQLTTKKNIADNPFIPIIPPVLLNEKSMEKTGYLPSLKEELYFLEKDNLYLAATSEHSIAAFNQDEIFEESELPKRYLGFSSCFRREAGSYGKDTKGIIRVHQFDKLEMFSFCKAEDSIKEHEFFLSLEESLMQKLEIPYQVKKICAGDLGVTAASKYDIEAYFPSENRYRETHSTSNCTDFQARRLNIKYKKLENKKQTLNFVHTVNGTALAIGRTIAAIIENHQKGDDFEIPKVLSKFYV